MTVKQLISMAGLLLPLLLGVLEVCDRYNEVVLQVRLNAYQIDDTMGDVERHEKERH